jgi:hypothetical protein
VNYYNENEGLRTGHSTWTHRIEAPTESRYEAVAVAWETA